LAAAHKEFDTGTACFPWDWGPTYQNSTENAHALLAAKRRSNKSIRNEMNQPPTNEALNSAGGRSSCHYKSDHLGTQLPQSTKRW
jgi:hypothetical protein